MALKKITWKSILFGCFSVEKQYPDHPKLEVSKPISSQRLSLSDLSNPGSPISVSDLSNSSVFNLQVFTLKELEKVTHNFSKSNILGEGGFGPVYKGFIDGKLRPGLIKAQPVAVKLLDLDGSQGHREWLAEVIFLGQLKHPNLVNLIGYCCEDEHRLLVYEYMERGNLDKQLFHRFSATLPWLTRLQIALGAAKCLAFLHDEEKSVIYRDFKASNILLDADFNAKLSDFGLATDGPQGEDSHVSTRVMGTEGYAAPEYIMTGHLTIMSDVYSFGVVLLELLTGLRSVDKNRPNREQNLVKWARPFLKDPHKLDQIMDPRLEGQYSRQGAKEAAALAYLCLSHHAKSRPSMSVVVSTLEPLLDLKDIPIGPFVYVVSNECENTSVVQGNMNEGQDDEKKIEEKIEIKNLDLKENDRDRQHKRRKYRRRIKPIKSRVVYSDTNLYKTLGSSLYSPMLA